jgi:hypothetical protein
VNLSPQIRFQVRQRANFACEFCGVTEIDAGGELTIDHFRPQTKRGTNELDNLVYCCPRCNQYKAAYWPVNPAAPVLWNPREEPIEKHLIALADGRLHPITETGTFTLIRLKLNRPELLAWRLRQQSFMEENRLLSRFGEIVTLMEQLHRQQQALIQEQREVLEAQRETLRLLIRRLS